MVAAGYSSLSVPWLQKPGTTLAGKPALINTVITNVAGHPA